MKKLILSTFVALILMFSAYSVAAENDDATLSLSSVSIEDGVSGRMQAKAQQIYVTSQQFFNSNMAQRLGFSQGQMQSSQNVQTPQAPQKNMQNQDLQNMQNMRQQGQQGEMNSAPSNMPAQNVPMQQPVPRIQQEMTDREQLRDFLQENTFSVTDVSEFQEYVTPYADAVQDYLDDEDLDDEDEIYEAAVEWIWVSDMTLNGQQEEWLTPTEFLEDTPDYDSNPVPGEIVSDCEDQANTLASLLIGSGEYDESEVRVAIGLVNFDGSTGGHAWIEVYEDGEWFPVDATVGPYYDDDEKEVIYPDDYEDIDFDYFQDEEYSVIEIWYYYNNEYFIDVTSGTGDAPDNWDDAPSSYN
ncbi:transglutaminase domain-containing protein [Methanolobus sediminis]|uniref:Transglutaminase domain-containing protein n=1 Tax=Methanolobus sediminis TaxID=3072978 RepID=A0AA51UM16_9EURY|nr:transglutaminase domain-containing protein [Methanolobus sediminis]WMW26061.1 transglutaminase domain-containing protein [Methanolobus sediminis]